MDAELSDRLLERCSQFVEVRAALHFPRERWPDLLRGLRLAAPDLGCADAEECAERLLADTDREALDAVVTRLTVGETYFYRDRHAFAALENLILRELIRARRGDRQRLRIWSAGCCTGEEPYSIAMSVTRLLPDLAKWDVSILGTDINPRFLHKAERGIYGPWSFRGEAEEPTAGFLRPVAPKRWEVEPRIRRMVTFATVNLAEDVYPSVLNQTNAMDIIFCRNVLMYFSIEQAKKVVGNLHRALVDGGWLLPAGAEASRELFGEFTSVEVPQTVLYRKAAPESPAVPKPTARSKAPQRIEAHAPVMRPVAKVAPSPAERARQLANTGELADALAACDAALQADKLSPAHHYLRGLILQEQGAAEEAAAAMRGALYLDPEFILAHFALGNTHRRAGRNQEATRCFANARNLLRRCSPDTVLPESDGLTAGRLLAMLEDAA